MPKTVRMDVMPLLGFGFFNPDEDVEGADEDVEDKAEAEEVEEEEEVEVDEEAPPVVVFLDLGVVATPGDLCALSFNSFELGEATVATTVVDATPSLLFFTGVVGFVDDELVALEVVEVEPVVAGVEVAFVGIGDGEEEVEGGFLLGGVSFTLLLLLMGSMRSTGDGLRNVSDADRCFFSSSSTFVSFCFSSSASLRTMSIGSTDCNASAEEASSVPETTACCCC